MRLDDDDDADEDDDEDDDDDIFLSIRSYIDAYPVATSNSPATTDNVWFQPLL